MWTFRWIGKRPFAHYTWATGLFSRTPDQISNRKKPGFDPRRCALCLFVCSWSRCQFELFLFALVSERIVNVPSVRLVTGRSLGSISAGVLCVFFVWSRCQFLSLPRSFFVNSPLNQCSRLFTFTLCKRGKEFCQGFMQMTSMRTLNFKQLAALTPSVITITCFEKTHFS